MNIMNYVKEKISELEKAALEAQSNPSEKNEIYFENLLENYLSDAYSGGNRLSRDPVFDIVPLLLTSNAKLRSTLDTRIEIDLRGDFRGDGLNLQGQKYTILKYKINGKTKIALTSLPYNSDEDMENVQYRFDAVTELKPENFSRDGDFDHRCFANVYAFERGCTKVISETCLVESNRLKLKDGEFAYIYGGWVGTKNTEGFEPLGNKIIRRNHSDVCELMISTANTLYDKYNNFIKNIEVEEFFKKGDGYVFNYESGALGGGNELAQELLRFKGYSAMHLIYDE